MRTRENDWRPPERNKPFSDLDRGKRVEFIFTVIGVAEVAA